MPEPLRVARRPAYLALAFDPRQTLPRIEDDPAPLVELVLEQGQQRELRSRLAAFLRKQRPAVKIEKPHVQVLLGLHRIKKSGVLDQATPTVDRHMIAR